MKDFPEAAVPAARQGENMRRFQLSAAALALAACGGSSGIGNNGQGTCSVTLSGAQTGTYDCQAGLGSYSTSDNKSGFGAGTTGATPPTLAFAFVFAGDLKTGTFKDTDAGANSAVTVQTASNAFWSENVGLNNSDPKRGSYTLNITSTGTRVTGNQGAAYLAVQGTLTAVLEPVAGTGATGNVNLTATFR